MITVRSGCYNFMLECPRGAKLSGRSDADVSRARALGRVAPQSASIQEQEISLGIGVSLVLPRWPWCPPETSYTEFPMQDTVMRDLHLSRQDFSNKSTKVFRKDTLWRITKHLLRTMAC